MKFTKALLLIGTMMAAIGLSSARAITINFTGDSATSGTAGNVRSFSSEGVTVNVSADTRFGSAWQPSYVGIYPSGLGVTNSTEGTGAGEGHSTGDVSGIDRIIFSFSTAVMLHTIGLDAYYDTDMTLWRFAAGVWTALENNFGAWNDRVASVNAGGLASTLWAVSALQTTDSNSDSFKISSIDFCTTPTVQQAPPPPSVPDSGSSLLLLALAFVSVAFLRGRMPIAA